MSIIDRILPFRPKANDAVSLREALAKARENEAAVLSRVAELERNRGALLLRGGASEVKASEEELIAARLDAERVGSLIASLEAEIPAAEEREYLTGIAAKIKQANELRAEFLRRWRREYPAAAARIVALLELEMEAERARFQAARMGDEAYERKVPAAAIEAVMKDMPPCGTGAELSSASGITTALTTIGSLVRLPSAESTPTATPLDIALWPQPNGKREWE